jgi:hypothetical protein
MLFEAAGLVGVLTILAAYALVQLHRLDQRGAVSLLMNFAGSSLILVSLSRQFNLSAALIEAAWALISLAGLAALLWRTRRR